MLRAVLMDQLSEFLMVEQTGLELYRAAAGRATDPELKAKYTEFGRETAHHREVLVRLITRLGGDPDHISPTARAAQFKASKLLESTMAVDGMSQQERDLNDLENVLLAETKDHADWQILRRMAEQAERDGLGAVAEKAGSLAGAGLTAATGGPSEQVDTAELADALREAVDAVGDDEDEHLSWARETHADMSLRMGMMGPAPSAERWQTRITNPQRPLAEDHARPHTDQLLEGARLPHWVPSPVMRDMTG
jgi:rubrerythrin